MVSDKKNRPKLNPNKPKKKSVKDIVIKKFDTNKPADYSSEFIKNDDEIESETIIDNNELETKNDETKDSSKTEVEDTNDGESSSLNPLDSVKNVIKKRDADSNLTKPSLNASPNDLKPKETSNPIKNVIKKTESEVRSVSDTTIDSFKEVIKKFDSDTPQFKSNLKAQPNNLTKTWLESEEESGDETEKSSSDKEKSKGDDSNDDKKFEIDLDLLNLNISISGYAIKILDFLLIILGLILILAGMFTSLGVTEKFVDNVVFGEKSTIAFLLAVLGILIISAVIGPDLIKKSPLKGFYEQLQNVDAEHKEEHSSDKSDSENDEKQRASNKSDS